MLNQHRWIKADLSSCLLIFFSSLILYFWSMPRTVVLEDDGFFLLTAWANGVAHPPGYPLYTLMAHFATLVPFGSVAVRVHAFTAMLGSLCCVSLYFVIQRLLADRTCALIAALAYSVSLTFWSQSIIAEVYTLNVLIFLLLLLLALYYADCDDSVQRQRLLDWMGLAYGLGLSNHWPLLGLSTPAILLVLLPHWREVVRQFPRSALFGMLGLLPYAWMVWRSQMDPLISFYGPIESWREFRAYVGREIYTGVDVSPTAGLKDKLAFMGFIFNETVRQYTLIGFIPVLIGFVRQWRQWSWQIGAALTLGYLGGTVLLISLLGFDFDYLHQNFFRVYPLIPYSICAIWLALGVKVIIEYLTRSSASANPKLIKGMTGMLVIVCPLMANAADNYRATDTWAEDFARTVLDSLEPGAILITYGDIDVCVIGYVRYILGHRPDVTLYDHKGTVFPNRLFKPYTLSESEAEATLSRFVNSTLSPVYYTYRFPHDYGETDFGLFMRIDRQNKKEQQMAIVLPRIRQYFETILARGEPMDNWEKMHYRILTAINCLQSVRLEFSSLTTQTLEQLQHDEWTERICDGFQAKMLHIAYLLDVDGIHNKDLPILLEQAEKLKHQAIAHSELVQLEQYKQKLRGNQLH